jgi:hypothetical protein
MGGFMPKDLMKKIKSRLYDAISLPFNLFVLFLANASGLTLITLAFLFVCTLAIIK